MIATPAGERGRGQKLHRCHARSGAHGVPAHLPDTAQVFAFGSVQADGAGGDAGGGAWHALVRETFCVAINCFGISVGSETELTSCCTCRTVLFGNACSTFGDRMTGAASFVC